MKLLKEEDQPGYRLLADSEFIRNANQSLKNMNVNDLVLNVIEAGSLNTRLYDLRSRVDIIDWWLDNGDDISIRELIDTIRYLDS